MGYINIFIEKPCSISILNNKLRLVGEKEAYFPLEDINAIMLENLQSSITIKALSRLCERGVAVYVCDEKHLPCGISLPFSTYFKELGMLKSQIELPKPQKKRIWQEIVVRKIENQAACYEGIMEQNAKELKVLVNDVQSGDVKNVEAQAAKKYFSMLFGETFKRDLDNLFNGAVNYAYAIVRGQIARTLVVHGFEMSLGFFHKNLLNRFNLADDLLEPYRGIVDFYVLKLIEDFKESDLLTPILKKELFSILNIDVLIDGGRQSLKQSIEIFVSSILRAISEGSSILKMPSLLPVKIHTYE